MQGHTNEGTEKKKHWIPAKNCGNDRRGKPAGMTEGTGQARQKGQAGTHKSPFVIPNAPPLSFPTRSIAPLSFPTSLIGNPRLFPCRAAQMKGQKRKNTGFPLKPAGMTEGESGIDRGDRAGTSEGASGDTQVPLCHSQRLASVIPDAFNRPSCHSRHL